MSRPLLICDCDEVLLHFAAPFRDYLGDVHDLELRFDSFALSGNIRHRASGALADDLHMPALLDHFFETRMGHQPLVEGVAEALVHIQSFADVVVLTNIEDHHQARRAEQLAALGLALEVHSNQGPKGPAVSRLAAGRGPVVFVDDLPPHHRSVAQHAPAVHRLHMVAEPLLRPLLGPAEDAHARIDTWPQARTWIEARLIGV